ncbi:MAG TPA: DUF2272 domain-containing protein [Candidatus Binatia bacterium]|nr:DUF2272 domain-containing protein [Candidatus Binatia bacterium]
MRTLVASLAALLTLSAASAEPSPLSRGELTFRHHANGMQYPAYSPRRTQSCAPAHEGDLRQRLVDLAVQEWARFGYPLSQRGDAGLLRQVFPELAFTSASPYLERDPLMLQAIGGYWAALSGVASGDVVDTGAYEIDAANALWENYAGEYRANPGWRTPWSAAFISWLMCEGGAQNFRRSWAHRDYVDAAIAAADGGAAHAYHARDPDIAPSVGDLLCSSRADYRADLANRRSDPQPEAGMHCDLVVAIDPPTALVLAIGGNVDNAVALVPYRLMGVRGGVRIRSVCPNEKVCADERLFALLTLQAPGSAAALAHAPALNRPPAQPPPRFRR